MTPFTSVHLANTGMRAERLTVTSRSGLGWLSRVLLLSLSCFVANCTDTSPSSSPNGVGGANASTGGAKGSDASASGGADKDSTSTQKSASGGASVENESGGAPSSSSAASAAKGGAGGNKSNAPSGGTATSGGASGSGGAAVTGGASNETQPNKGGAAAGGKSSKGSTASSASGATSTGGKSGSGGASATGGKSGVPIGGATGTGGATASGTFTLTSPGWTAMAGCGPDAKTSCPPLPAEITRTGAGTSPELHWTGAPAGTKSFVVVLQDLNNKTAHWILWNIPATATGLAANVDRSTATPAVPAGSQQCGKGTEAATSDGYYGPGAPCNVYEFLVYALSVEKFSPTGDATDQESVRTQLQALGSSILGTASLRGRTNSGC